MKLAVIQIILNCFKQIIVLFIMGGAKSKTNLIVATLNYSGIIASPYQFYQNLSDEERQLNSIFYELSREYFDLDQHYNWSFGTIDKDWHSRYSPLYRWNIGIKSNKVMMNEKQFLEAWINKFEQIEQESSVIGYIQLNSKQKGFQIKEYLSNQFLNEKIMKKQFPELTEKYSRLKSLKQQIANSKIIAGAEEKFQKQMKLLKNEKKQIQKNIQQKLPRYIAKIMKKREPSIMRIKRDVLKIEETQKIFGKSINKYGTQLKDKQSSEDIFELIMFQLMMFDFLVYKSILIQIYGREQASKIHNEVFELSGKKYRAKRKQKFNKSFLDKELKVKLTIDLIEKLKIDIFFIQEATKDLVKAIQGRKKNYRVVRPLEDKNQWSIIVICDDKFPKIQSLRIENRIFFNNINKITSQNVEKKYISMNEIKSMNINKDTVVQALGNIILVGAHLTSKKQINAQQLKEVRQICKKLEKWFPEATIIVGGDLNGDFTLKEDEDFKNFTIFPQASEQFTTHKKRTYMQAQRHKAYNILHQPEEQKQQAPKDYLISNKQFKNLRIRTIYEDKSIHKRNELGSQVPLIPSHNHPFDHYLVIGSIQIDENQIQHVLDVSYKYKYNPENLTDEQLKQFDQRRKQINF